MMITRVCAILCGVTLTWACAAFGLRRLLPRGCSSARVAQFQVREIASVVRHRAYDRQCPATREELIASGSIAARTFVDPWGTSIVYSCSDEGPEADPKVRSAGPDRAFNTADDITNER